MYEHLQIDRRCMAAMGGSVEEAKRYVRNMKDQSRNQADKDSQKQRFKVYHHANKKKVNKKNCSSQYLTFPLRERSERVGLSACVKHGHVVQSPNFCWPVFVCSCSCSSVEIYCILICME